MFKSQYIAVKRQYQIAWDIITQHVVLALKGQFQITLNEQMSVFHMGLSKIEMLD